MSVKVIMFGKLADIANSPVVINNPVDTDSLIKVLQSAYPALKEAKYIVAVNKEVITSNTILREDMVVALLPPFSGG